MNQTFSVVNIMTFMTKFNDLIETLNHMLREVGGHVETYSDWDHDRDDDDVDFFHYFLCLEGCEGIADKHFDAEQREDFRSCLEIKFSPSDDDSLEGIEFTTCDEGWSPEYLIDVVRQYVSHKIAASLERVNKVK